MYVEFHLEDEATYYMWGCPDPITDTVLFSTNAMLTDIVIWDSGWQISGYDSFGGLTYFQFNQEAQSNTYLNSIMLQSLYNLGFLDDGLFGSQWGGWCNIQLPFPPEWEVTENGLEFPMCWGFAENLIDWTIIPYWHYAE